MPRKNKLRAYQMGIIAIAVLAVGVVAAAYTSQIDAPNQVFEGDCVNCDLRALDQREQRAEEVTLGAAAGPELMFDYLNFNGIVKHYEVTNFRDASTTLASILNPGTGTTSCVVDRLNITNGTTTVDVFIATSTSATIGPTGLLKGWMQLRVATSAPEFTLQISDATPLPDGVTNQGDLYNSFLVGPDEYILVHATSSYAGSSGLGKQGITNGNNSFTGGVGIVCTD